MRLVATGGAGYIGSVVVERALAAGHQVTVLDNLSEGHAGAVPAAARFVRGDVGDPTVLDALLSGGQCDAVIHLAAETTIATSMTDPGRYFRQNTAATLTLLDRMQAHGVNRLVFSSTAAVYGEPDEIPIRETHATRPVNPYGESKLMCERIAEWFSRAHGLAVVAFRYFNAAGASALHGEAHRHESHLIPVVLRAAVQGGTIPVHGVDYPTADGSCVRDFVHVVDIADAHLAALPAVEQLRFSALNLGTGRGYSVLQVIDAARRVSGLECPVVVRPRRPGDPASLVADGSLARQQLGWRPRHSDLPEILASAWAWTGAHPDGYS